MNWYLQNNTERKGRGTLIAVSVVVFMLVIADVVSGGLLRAHARDALVVPVRAASAIGDAFGSLNFFSSRSVLRAENAALAEELARFHERDALFRALTDEITHLRAAARVVGEGGGITAAVISARSILFGTFLVDAGLRDGVSAGDLVLSEAGIAIGSVESVGEGSAQVRLLFAPGSTIEVFSGDAAFTLEGRGGGNARAKVPREMPLSLHDVLHATEAGGRPVGVVGHLATASSSAFSDVYTYVPTNFETLRFVIITPR